jgi:DNA-binding MarR family transcriptional regulator
MIFSFKVAIQSILTISVITSIVSTVILVSKFFSRAFMARLQNNASKPSKERTKLESDVVINLARLMTKNADQMSTLISQHGLSLAHFNVLRILRGAKSDGLPCGTVGERLINKEPDMTRLLDRMEKQNLVVRSRDQADRRIVTARITIHGLEILKALDEPLENLLHQHFGHVSSQKLEAFLEVIAEIRGRAS